MQDDDARLRTDLLVMAQTRRLSDRGVPVYVARKGAAESGSVLIRVPGPAARTSRLWTQARDLDGSLGWLPAFKGEAVADDEVTGYIERAVKRDPDLWVVEAEPPDGRNPFDGKEIAPWPAPAPPRPAGPPTGRPPTPTDTTDGPGSSDPAEAARNAAQALFKRPR